MIETAHGGNARTRQTIVVAAVTTLFAYASHGVISQEKRATPTAKPILIADPTLMLLRDESVLAELGAKPEQRKAIRDALDGIDKAFFALRDVGAAEGAETLRSLTSRVMARAKAILKPPQFERLEQLVLQAQGTEALLLTSLADKLAMSPAQRQQAEKLYRDVRDAVADLSKQSSDANRAQNLEKAAKLLADAREQIVAVLTDEQTKKWDALKGEPFDFSGVRPGPFKAPEIDGGDTWINSEPLTLAKLRGQVVVVHFWTFG